MRRLSEQGLSLLRARPPQGSTLCGFWQVQPRSGCPGFSYVYIRIHYMHAFSYDAQTQTYSSALISGGGLPGMNADDLQRGGKQWQAVT